MLWSRHRADAVSGDITADPASDRQRRVTSVSTQAQYWDTVGARSTGRHRQTLWRVHSDVVNSAWVARRLSMAPIGRLLKTDLFDEALAAGLYPLLSARGRTVIGVDVAVSTVRAARVRYGQLQGAGADVRALPFATGAFDAVVSNSTLDHFASAADIVASLNELQRVLRAGGQLLLTLDNLANPVVALRNALPFRPLHALGILPYQIGAACGPGQLQRDLCAAGFEVLGVDAILHCPRVFAVAAAAILERCGSSRAQRYYLRCLMPFERLAGWRTRFLTGYFTAIVARKR
jgi:SAM-dependent methyltransferase